MKVDVYTKVVLTIIAVALSLLVLQNGGPQAAYAEAPAKAISPMGIYKVKRLLMHNIRREKDITVSGVIISVMPDQESGSYYIIYQ